MHPTFVLFGLFALFASFGASTLAQVPAPPKPLAPPPNILKHVGLEQKLGAVIPADLAFRDETGRAVKIGDYYGDKPIILSLVYFKCPSLCTMVLNDLVRSMRTLEFSAGKDFQVLTVSFDPSETPALAAQKKATYVREYRRANAAQGWHFLTGDAKSIASLTQTVGFHYAWDPASQTYAHASGIIVLTPSGTVSRYFYGIDYAPSDLKLALIAASGQKIGSPVERILLYCFHYDPRSGRYGVQVWRAVQVGCSLTFLLLAGFVTLSLFQERRRRPRAIGASGSRSFDDATTRYVPPPSHPEERD
jgi:protein SCO1/2